MGRYISHWRQSAALCQAGTGGVTVLQGRVRQGMEAHGFRTGLEIGFH